MKKYRVVESRVMRGMINGKIVAVTRYYVEEGDRFLFWTLWNRYLNGFDTPEEARDFKNDLESVTNSKDRVL